ncbi:hypothetical protein [Streptomyces sp. NRRL S-1022]|nr:hypothetical protein [Streptomyces sp. NRRL S-1022]
MTVPGRDRPHAQLVVTGHEPTAGSPLGKPAVPTASLPVGPEAPHPA